MSPAWTRAGALEDGAERKVDVQLEPAADRRGVRGELARRDLIAAARERVEQRPEWVVLDLVAVEEPGADECDEAPRVDRETRSGGLGEVRVEPESAVRRR